MNRLNTQGKLSIMFIITAFVVSGLMVSAGTALAAINPIDLGTAGDFVILSHAGITDSSTSIITGNIGTDGVASSIGVPCGEVTGTIYAIAAGGPSCSVIDATLLGTAMNDMQTAYTFANGQATSLFGLNQGSAGEIGGLTLDSGVYTFDGANINVKISTELTLNGGTDDVWIFQIPGTFDVHANVKLGGSAQAKNIFWVVAGATTLFPSSVVNGTILDHTSIAMQKLATLNGRALAQTESVTLIANTITAPGDIAPPPSACSTNGTLTKEQAMAASSQYGGSGITVAWALVDGKETATITNTTGKFLPVSLISYQMFDRNLGSQQFFDGTNVVVVDSCNPVTLTVSLPSCMAQVDLYFDVGPHVLYNDNRDRFSTLSWDYYQNDPGHEYDNAVGNFCHIPIVTPPTATSTLIVINNLINNNGGTSTPSMFTLTVTGASSTPVTFPGSASGTPVTINASSTYNVTEATSTGYTTTFSPDCSGTIPAGETRTCTITNDDIAPPPSACSTNGTLTLSQVRSAIESGEIHVTWALVGGTETATITNTTGSYLPVSLISYQMFDHNLGSQQFFNGTEVTNVDSCHPTTLIVNLPSCMAQIDLYFGVGPHVLYNNNRGKVITLSWAYYQNGNGLEYDNAVGNFCHIPSVTPPTATSTLIVIKNVVNNNGGTSTPSMFTLTVTGASSTPVTFPGSASGTPVTINASSTYNVTEATSTSYTAIFSNACSGTIPAGETRTCTVTNDDVIPPSSGGDGGSEAATTTLTIIKNIINNNSGNATSSDFTINITNNATTTAIVSSSTSDVIVLNAGTFSVAPVATSTYSFSTSGSCSGAVPTTPVTCTITFDDIAPAGSTAPVVVTSSGSRGGHSGQFSPQVLGASTGPQGEVLGASTSCGPYLNSYLRIGYQNDSAEVTKLQKFLNGEIGSTLPISGLFDSSTFAAVNSFQLKYKTDVLLPWVIHGLPNENTPTGYVYKTTKYMINKIMCPSLGLTTPPLP